jgi:hypothetical protein
MSIYTPTYLYIKQHSVTGKQYFGKTINNPEKYQGSGLYWLRHIKEHGKEHIITLWYCLFLDKESIQEFALTFSEQQNIVKSEDWLNLIPENGKAGGCIKGKPKQPFSAIHRSNLSKSQKLRKPSSQETRDKISAANTGRTAPFVTCPHCNKTGGAGGMTNWHFDNCKKNPNYICNGTRERSTTRIQAQKSKVTGKKYDIRTCPTVDYRVVVLL